MIEPKPKEPTKHQYDSDAAACINFLRQYDLLDHFKLNIETNHATLAGHTMMHELDYVERNPLRANLVERAEDWRFGSLWRWAQQAEPLPKLLAPWPIPRTPNGIERVN